MFSKSFKDKIASGQYFSWHSSLNQNSHNSIIEELIQGQSGQSSITEVWRTYGAILSGIGFVVQRKLHLKE